MSAGDRSCATTISRCSCDSAGSGRTCPAMSRSEEHTSEPQPPCNLACRLLLDKKNSEAILCFRLWDGAFQCDQQRCSNYGGVARRACGVLEGAAGVVAGGAKAEPENPRPL